LPHGLRFRRLGALACVTGLLVLGLGWAGLSQDSESDAVEYPFSAKDFPKGWVATSADPKADVAATWHLQPDPAPRENVLICTGKPDGYLRTEKAYENFELGLEWKYASDPNGNSGILLFVTDKDLIWPKSLQIQLHRPTAGSVIPHGGAKAANMLTAKDLSKPLPEWNSCHITCDRGKITVVLNGQKVGEVTGCMPSRGAIGLQSEGSEIHFRRLWIKPLKAAPESP
jgi:hypothetical protein